MRISSKRSRREGVGAGLQGESVVKEAGEKE